MSNTSKIEWTDATWNPTTGCTKVSPGCKHCYAERLWPKVEGARVKREGGERRPFTDVRCHPDRLEAPLHWREPRMVFVDSMSDLFHADVPFPFIADVFAVMSCTTRHTYQVLTKRPERMLEFFAWLNEKTDNPWRWPDRVDALRVWPQWTPVRNGRGGYDNCGPAWPLGNVWLGVSIEDQPTVNERIPLLLKAPAAVLFVSAEPLLGPIDLSAIDIGDAILYPLHPWVDVEGRGRARSPRVDWVITGGESGSKARPSHPSWFRSLRDQCKAADVPFFFKQWGNWAPIGLPESLKYRGAAIDLMGMGPPVSSIRTFIDGDFNVLAGRIHVSFVPKTIAGRLLDGIEHNEFPASPFIDNKEFQ